MVGIIRCGGHFSWTVDVLGEYDADEGAFLRRTMRRKMAKEDVRTASRKKTAYKNTGVSD